MSRLLDFLVAGVAAALFVICLGFIARGYYLLFMLGWELL